MNFLVKSEDNHAYTSNKTRKVRVKFHPVFNWFVLAYKIRLGFFPIFFITIMHNTRPIRKYHPVLIDYDHQKSKT